MVCKKNWKARVPQLCSEPKPVQKICVVSVHSARHCTVEMHNTGIRWQKNAHLLICCQHFSSKTSETASSRCSAMCIYPRDDLLHLRDCIWSISRPQIDAIRNDKILKLSDFVLVWFLTKLSEFWKKSALKFLCVPFWCMQWSWQTPETSSNATSATYPSHRPLFQTLETPKTAQTKCSTACLVISTLSW